MVQLDSEKIFIKIESNPTNGSNRFLSKIIVANKDDIKEIEKKTTKLIEATEEDPSLLFVNLIKKEDEDKEQLENYFKKKDEKLNTFRGIGVHFQTMKIKVSTSDVKPKDDEEHLVIRLIVLRPKQFADKVFILKGPKGDDLPDGHEFFYT